MRLVVQPGELDCVGARLRLHEVILDGLRLCATMESAVAAAPGTQFAAAATVAVTRLHATIYQARFALAMTATRLGAAANCYRSADEADEQTPRC